MLVDCLIRMFKLQICEKYFDMDLVIIENDECGEELEIFIIFYVEQFCEDVEGKIR